MPFALHTHPFGLEPELQMNDELNDELQLLITVRISAEYRLSRNRYDFFAQLKLRNAEDALVSFVLQHRAARRIEPQPLPDATNDTARVVLHFVTSAFKAKDYAAVEAKLDEFWYGKPSEPQPLRVNEAAPRPDGSAD